MRSTPEDVGFRNRVVGECRNAQKTKPSEFRIDAQERKQIAHFRPLEKIAKIKQWHAQLFENAGDAAERQVRAGKYSLLTIRNTRRAQLLDPALNGLALRRKRRRGRDRDRVSYPARRRRCLPSGHRSSTR